MASNHDFVAAALPAFWGSIDDYCYESLSPRRSAERIRILVLFPGASGSEIECDIQEIVVGDPRWVYEALSYAWGASSIGRFIHVRSRGKLFITSNLYAALQALRRSRQSRILWVDAICINQENSTEKSQQVSLMAEIYAGASSVVAWIGESDEESDIAFDWADSTLWRPDLMTRYLQASRRENFRNDPPLFSATEFNIPPRVIKALFSTFDSRRQRTWWKRRWVAQEIVCAKDIVFICGSRILPWTTLSICLSYLRLTDDHLIPFNSVSSAVMALSKISNYMELRRQRENGCGSCGTLDKVLMKFQDFECTDPRDCIYSLLGLTTFLSASIQPDYNKSVADVFLDATRTIIGETQRLDVLTSRLMVDRKVRDVEDPEVAFGGTDPSLELAEATTSWVVDFEDLKKSNSSIMPSLYKASLHLSTPPDILASPNTRILCLQGVFIDSIANLQSQYTFRDPWSMRDKDAELRWLFELIHFKHIPSTYPTGECGFTAFWRALLRDVSRPTAARAVFTRLMPENVHTYEWLWKAWFTRAAKQLDAIKGVEDEEINKKWMAWFGKSSKSVDGTAEEAKEAEELWHYWLAKEEEFAPTSRSRRLVNFGTTLQFFGRISTDESVFCVTKAGYMGWLPKHARVQDYIYVPYGSDVPFVLRPLREAGSSEYLPEKATAFQNWQLVGACYVHGIMDGEAVKAVQEGKLAEQRVNII